MNNLTSRLNGYVLGRQTQRQIYFACLTNIFQYCEKYTPTSLISMHILMTGSDGMFGAKERKQAAAATLLGTELPGSQRRQMSGTWSRIREMVVQVLRCAL